MCIGLFCRKNQILSKNLTCEEYHLKQLKLPEYLNAPFVHFNLSHDPQKNETTSQKYLRTLMSNQTKLMVEKKFDKTLFDDYSVFLKTYFIGGIPNFSNTKMPFIAAVNNSTYEIVDYKCSDVDINLKFLKIGGRIHSNYIKIANFISLCMYGLVLFLFLIIQEIRTNINGKCLMMYSLVQFLFYLLKVFHSKLLVSAEVTEHSIFILRIVSFIWLALISCDYWTVIR